MNDYSFLMRYAMTAQQIDGAVACARKVLPITAETYISIMTLPYPPRESQVEEGMVEKTVDVFIDGDYRFAYFPEFDHLIVGLRQP